MSFLESLKGRMAGEKFHIIRGPLTFSESRIEISVHPGEIRKGTFLIYGARGVNVAGFVSSSCISMQCLTTEFSGSSDEIVWVFDAHGYEAGNVENGYFRIISNQGEYKLPFTVTVANASLGTRDGDVSDLVLFANLAKQDWDEALRLFYDPKFGGMLKSQSSDDKTSEAWYLWRGLSHYKGNEYNLEEFLISTDRKSPIEYLPEIEEIKTVLPAQADGDGRMPDYYFRLTRSGWGYTDIRVELDGDFLVPSTKHIGSRDFDASGSVEVHYFLDRTKMHAGRNFGSIHLTGGWCDITIPVTVRTLETESDPERTRREELETITVQMMKYYEDFRAKKMRGREWLQQTGLLVDRMTALNPDDPVAALYKVHLEISAGKQKEAAWELADFDRRVEETLGIPTYSDPEHRGLRRADPQLYAYRCYLGVLCAEDESRLSIYDSTERVEEELRKNPSDWRIAWILMYLSDEYQKRPSYKWKLLRQEFDLGCTSPVIYIEAYDMIRINPAILSDLDEFALQTLHYASKHDLLDEAVMEQVDVLSMRRKAYSQKLFNILKAGYEKGLLMEDTLQCIVSLLLRGNKTNKESFFWYAKGVDAELSVTRLFEYYMCARPEDCREEIPQVVLRYFCYQCSLPWQKAAELYAYLIRHRQENAELYRQALPAIQSFTLGELSKEHVSADMCYLYWHVLYNEVLTPDNAPAAVRVMFSEEIRTPVTEQRTLILSMDKRTDETSVPISGGRTVMPVYGTDHHLFLEDGNGNRSAVSAHFTENYLARYQDKISMLSAFDTGITDFDVYLTSLSGDGFHITAFNCERFRRLSEVPGLCEEYRQNLRLRLLHYYEESDRALDLTQFLAETSYEGFTQEQRSDFLSFLVSGGRSSQALSVVRACGIAGMNAGVLMRLVSGMISADGDLLPQGPEPAGEEEEKGGRVLSDRGPVSPYAAGTDSSAKNPGRHAVDSETRPKPDRADTLTEFAELVHEVFAQGKYDEKMILFLERNFEGLSVEMDDVRKAAERFDADAHPILPRMVTQLLYSGVVLEDEEDIISASRSNGAEDDVIAALLAQTSHYFFVDDTAVSPKIIERIGEFAEKGKPLYDVSRMAYLKSLASRSGEYRADELETAKQFLTDLTSQGIVFPFYRRFAGLLPSLQVYSDETLIQFKGRPGADVLLHYSVDRDESGSDIRRELPMKEMYDGIYVAGFVLFFGEQVRYFITDDPERTNVVESGTFGQDTRIAAEGDDRFAMINRISALAAMQKYDEALDAMEKYNRRANLVSKMFRRR